MQGLRSVVQRFRVHPLFSCFDIARSDRSFLINLTFPQNGVLSNLDPSGRPKTPTLPKARLSSGLAFCSVDSESVGKDKSDRP